MRSLLIDTHDTKVSYVLYSDGSILDKTIIDSNLRHSEIAMPTLTNLISKNGLSIDDIDEIISIIGPGSFTGVRIGVVISKTLSYLKNIPIKTLTSLDLKVFSNSIVVPGMYFEKEKNGYFIGKYDESGKIQGSIKYITSAEYIPEDYIDVLEYDYENIYKHSRDIKPINPFTVNPIYVKKIEALKWFLG